MHSYPGRHLEHGLVWHTPFRQIYPIMHNFLHVLIKVGDVKVKSKDTNTGRTRHDFFIEIVINYGVLIGIEFI